MAERDRLSLAELREWDVDIADIDVDHRLPRLNGGVARDIAGRLAMTDDVKKIRPDLVRIHGRNEVKERTSFMCVITGYRGAKLVTAVAMTSTPEQQDPDWPRYPDTILRFATVPPMEIDLRDIPSAKAVSQLRATGVSDPFAVITAFDPRGRNLSLFENEKRQRDLEQRLKAAGYKFVPVDACSPDQSHCERSVAVTIPQQDAIDIARDLDQIALFWFDGSRFWIVGAIVEADPLMLPRSS